MNGNTGKLEIMPAIRVTIMPALRVTIMPALRVTIMPALGVTFTEEKSTIRNNSFSLPCAVRVDSVTE